MKFVGRADGPHTIICRLFDDDLADVAEATEFYADVPEFISAAAGLAAGTRSRAEIAEVPAVRPSARVLCDGLNYRLHAADAGLPIPEYPAFSDGGRRRWSPATSRFRCPMASPVWTGRWNSPWSSAGRCTGSTRQLRWAASSGTPRSTICPRGSTGCIRGCGLSARMPIGAAPSRRSSPPMRSATPPTGSAWCPGSTARWCRTGTPPT
jgi:hypothetical protein